MSVVNSCAFEKILLCNGSHSMSLPPWVLTLIWIGEHVRCFEVPGERLVSLVVVPRRDFASVFVALGALIGGVSTSRGDLNWDKFSLLEPDTRVFWRSPEGIQLSGKIIGVTRFENTPLISIMPDLKRGRKYENSKISISKSTFKSYQFSLEKFESSAKRNGRLKALEFYRDLYGDQVEIWRNNDLCEVLMVAEKVGFLGELTSLSLSTTSGQYDLESILHCADANSGVSAKTKLISPRNENVSNHSKVVVADGPLAFQSRDHFNQGANLIFIMDRVSISQDFVDFYSSLKDFCGELHFDWGLGHMPSIPSSIELASFRVKV